MMTLRGLAYSLAAAARCTIVRRLAWAPYGIHRSSTISPEIVRSRNRGETSNKENNLRGRGGRGGIRSMITDRGGTGIAPKRRITEQRNKKGSSNASSYLFTCLASDRNRRLWRTFAQDQCRWLRKGWGTLTNNERWWCRWLWWTHFFDDKRLQNRDKDGYVTHSKVNALRPAVEQGVVEEIGWRSSVGM